MIIEVLSKIISESLLSLYPIFIKKINIPFGLHLWCRFFIYVLVSFFFIDWKFVFEHLLSTNGILLSFVTILHIFFSYRGFQLLESGIAYVCFYTYPIMILLLSGEKMNFITILFLFIAIFGIYLLFSSSFISFSFVSFSPDFERKDEKKEKDDKETKKNLILGFIMVFLAAFTEAAIYFVVRRIPTNNNWNHLFISYFFGAIAFSIYYLFIGATKNNISIALLIPLLIAALLINFIIGLFGYYLRFYSITRLPTKIYALLSYVGIIMAFIYGVVFNREKITLLKIIGSIFIVVPVYWISSSLDYNLSKNIAK